MIRNTSSSQRLAELDDAFVDVDRSVDRWIVGNDAIVCSIRRARAGTLAFEGLFIGRSDDSLGPVEGADCLITVGGATHRLGGTGSPFVVESIDAVTGGDFVSLAVRFGARQQRVTATRHLLVRPRAGAIEVWTAFAVEGGEEDAALGDLNALALTVPAGSIEWVTGLEVPDAEQSFTKRSRNLDDGERLELESPVLSSLRTVPFFGIGNGHRRFFVGLAWSGAWSATLVRRGGEIDVTVGLRDMSALAREGRPAEGPHAVIGVVADEPGADTAALSQFVYASRGGRDFPAWTTFNTWFLRGTHINEDIVRADMDLASSIGIELFQVDAGWYPGSRPDAPFDFTPGLGSWMADPQRFPSGLGGLREAASARGLRLGIWVEPERVALDVVARNGLSERFLAQQDGRYDPTVPNEEARDAQLCLADPAARGWVLERLTQLIDESGVENLKWDFNRWVTCTREGHGHPANGGNFEHTRALYEILETLRARYPWLMIENCAGGARRADLAMARLTDTAWMDDRSAPSSHVRYNLDGLLTVFPAPYLFSYVMSHATESVKGHADIAMLVRSRMPGVVGITEDLGALDERELNELHQQMELAKRLRAALGHTTTYVLTPQTANETEWRVLQEVSHANGTSAVFAYSYGLDVAVRVELRQIKPDATYELRSADRGRLGLLRGADLVVDGLEIRAAPESAVQVLILAPVAASARVK